MKIAVNGRTYAVSIVGSLGGPSCLVVGQVVLVVGTGDDATDAKHAARMIEENDRRT